jgi:hypothetical protein
VTRLKHEGKDATTGEDAWTLHFVEVEANILAGLPDQLEVLLANPDSNRRVIQRLFPVSYDDPEEEALNRQLLGDSLLSARQEMITEIRDQLSGGRATDEGLELSLDRAAIDLWLRFMNDVRLIIATDLGIEENISDESAVDPASPNAPKYALLEYLGGVEAILIEAVSRVG